MLALAAIASCGDPPPPERAPTIAIDSAGVQVVTSDPRNSDAYCTPSDEPTLTLGVIEGEEPYMFNWVRGANRLSDGSIAVMNNSSGEIRIFGADGRHPRSMGGKGEGPGEFKIGRFIWVLPGDTPWVGDYRPWRYHVGRGSEQWHPSDDDAISDRRPVADVFPTVTSVQVGRDGRLWVYPYGRPGTTEDWWAFGTDGDFQCRLDHPAGVAIYEFGADYLLGMHSDDLGVERVVMYGLGLPETGSG